MLYVSSPNLSIVPRVSSDSLRRRGFAGRSYFRPMIRHYLTFAHQARLLHRLFAGWRVTACWGQEKDRLVLTCEGPERGRGVELSVDLRIGYALPVAEIHPPKRNRVDLFGDISGERIEEIDIDPQERALRIALDSGRELVAPFYGPGGGNLLLIEAGEVIDSYRSLDHQYDSLLDQDREEIPEYRDPTGITANPEIPLQRGLMQWHRRLGPRLALEAIVRSGLDPEVRCGDVGEEGIERLVGEVDRLWDAAVSTREYYLYGSIEEAIFSLVELTTLPAGEYTLQVYDDLPKAIRRFRSLWFRTEQFGSLRKRLVATLEKERGRLQKGLDHALQSESHRDRAEEWEMMGNLLLANLHRIERGSREVQLDDWDGGSVTVKLDPKLSPAENADRLFRKARGARLEAERGIGRSVDLERSLAEVEERLDAVRRIEGVEQYDELARLADGVVREDTGKKDEARENRFRRFTVSDGIEVYVGKNARNNDELTGGFARPNDIWLHARGTSGSHVVMRWDRREENPPARALNEAAMIAAWYSGARGSTLVPVAWTRRKYVRKPKGAAPGAVLMTREEVLIVEPHLPSNDK